MGNIVHKILVKTSHFTVTSLFPLFISRETVDFCYPNVR
jgi:hypothetical protein